MDKLNEDEYKKIKKVMRGRESTGDRLATTVIILQEPVAGGATVFPYAGVSSFPEIGDGIFWKNLLKNEDADVQTMHKACPILEGIKTIGNKWIGYNNQWSSHPCGMVEESISIETFRYI